MHVNRLPLTACLRGTSADDLLFLSLPQTQFIIIQLELEWLALKALYGV